MHLAAKTINVRTAPKGLNRGPNIAFKDVTLHFIIIYLYTEVQNSLVLKVVSLFCFLCFEL